MWSYQHVSWYLNASRRAFEITKAGGRIKMDWAGEPLDHDGFKVEFRRALHRRISLKAGRQESGRRHTQDYRIGLLRDKYRLQDMARRIRVYQFETDIVNRRFGHRLARHDD